MMRRVAKLLFVLSFALNIAMVIYIFGPDHSKKADLDLDSSQLLKIKELRGSYMEKNIKVKKKIKECQDVLMKALERDKISKTEVYRCVEEISELQEQVQKNSIDEIIDIKKLLNRKQCQCFMTEVSRSLNRKKSCPCGKKRH